jgi:hypothetical protein
VAENCARVKLSVEEKTQLDTFAASFKALGSRTIAGMEHNLEWT